jgi:hypothetical protein
MDIVGLQRRFQVAGQVVAAFLVLEQASFDGGVVVLSQFVAAGIAAVRVLGQHARLAPGVLGAKSARVASIKIIVAAQVALLNVARVERVAAK